MPPGGTSHGLGRSVGAFIDERDFDRIMDEFSRHFSTFVDRLGDRLPVERRHVVERLMANASRLFAECYLPRRHLTIVRGDAHFWNALCPKDPARVDVRLIDWDGWRIGVAARDLAYMIALHWYPDRRRRFERRCLEHYHAILVESGVHGYDFDALWLDYRRSVLWHVMTPIWQAAIKLGPWIWFGHFERTMMAVDDLGCLELLD
jgi:thiamine kinase-like enzyme